MGVLVPVNQLKTEKSSYLQQHAQNPVHWRAWSKEAFAEAKRLDRMVLVSIGYSTCHWCHVMEHESFEDQEIADYLNTHFITIKVDREEHPEVDRFYMDALLRIQRSGGWPLNMFTLPDGRPIVGGTYFPKAAFLGSLNRLVQYWKSDRSAMEKQAGDLQSSLHGVKPGTQPDEMDLASFSKKLPEWQALFLQQQLSNYDPEWGGFGSAPKFPRSHNLGALLRAAESGGEFTDTAHAAVKQTLKAMAYGGLRDHVAGGFHRYSTDREWLAPHFEKMLYDQALLIESYSEAYAQFGDPFYRDIVEETFDYCKGKLLQENGLYGAGEDADTERTEGAYYTWTVGEIESVLTLFSEEEQKLFREHYPTSREGNWEGRNILRLDLSVAWERARDPKLLEILKTLLNVRSGRVSPLLDSKGILSWNALLATSLLKASFHLQKDADLSLKLKKAAMELLARIEELCGGDYSKLPRIYYGLETKGHAYLEDVAALALAFQYRSNLLPEVAAHAQAARGLLDFMLNTFCEKGQWKNAQVSEGIPDHEIQEEDGAVPGTLSFVLAALLRGARTFEESRYMEAFLKLLPKTLANLKRYPAIHSYLLIELDALEAPLAKIPASDSAAVLKSLGSEARFLSRLILRSHTRYEVCDWGQCRFAGEDSNAFVEAWKSR